MATTHMAWTFWATRVHILKNTCLKGKKPLPFYICWQTDELPFASLREHQSYYTLYKIKSATQGKMILPTSEEKVHLHEIILNANMNKNNNNHYLLLWAYHLPGTLLSNFMGPSIQFSEHYRGSKVDTQLPAPKPLLPLLSCTLSPNIFYCVYHPLVKSSEKSTLSPAPGEQSWPVSVNPLLCQLLIPARWVLPREAINEEKWGVIYWEFLGKTSLSSREKHQQELAISCQ